MKPMCEFLLTPRETQVLIAAVEHYRSYLMDKYAPRRGYPMPISKAVDLGLATTFLAYAEEQLEEEE